MAVTKASVVARAPEFASVSDVDFATAIADAQLQVNPAAWGTLSELAACYLVAHVLTLTRPDLAAPDVVQSERVGQISRTYAVSARASSHPLAETKYGRLYLTLRRQLGLGAMVV